MKTKKTLLFCLFIISLFSSTLYAQLVDEQRFQKIEESDDLDTIIKKATEVLPSNEQLEWQKLEFTGFIHFGLNTFNQVEWGSGTETPDNFNPSQLDAEQWVKNMKAAGIKLAMLTVKHHDGFCLWPSSYTEHSVKNTPWKNGKGNVVRELKEACDKYGLKLGIYLSPADLFQIESDGGYYGNGSTAKETTIPTLKSDIVNEQRFTYSLDDYNTYFMNQLYELLTQYGEIAEVWFDGANPKPGTGQEYNRKAWYDMIRKLQPNALIAIKGPDVRWCGNEAGNTRAAEWSVVPLQNNPNFDPFNDSMAQDLGSRIQLQNAKYLYWYPAETNTSIREGWFYRDDKQHVKSTSELLDIWFRSVGGNSVFLLNVTPDKRGLLPDKDVSVLQELGQIIRNTFDYSYLNDDNILSDKELSTYLSFNRSESQLNKPISITKRLDYITDINVLSIQEAIGKKGQRIEEIFAYVKTNGKWVQVGKKNVVGYKALFRFNTQINVDSVRFEITKSRYGAYIAEIGAYYQEPIVSEPLIRRDIEGNIHLYSEDPTADIYFSVDGTEFKKFNKAVNIDRKVIIEAYTQSGDRKSNIVKTYYDISPKKWTIVSSSSQQNGFEATKAIDSNESTFWHSNWSDAIFKKHPHQITVNFNEELNLKGFTYTPRVNGDNGTIQEYTLEISLDGESWTRIKDHAQFDNIKNNPVKQTVNFEKTYKARFIRIISHSALNNSPYASIRELGVITE